jgi:hypothetical protein
MGKIRRGGYVFEWWIGDHEPKHIHISDSSGEMLGRLTLENFEPLDDWKPPRKVIEIIQQIVKERGL